jgi:hypothetical protein
MLHVETTDEIVVSEWYFHNVAAVRIEGERAQPITAAGALSFGDTTNHRTQVCLDRFGVGHTTMLPS